jgi:hypothetical protein
MAKGTTEILDTRPCPVCAEPIKGQARKCIHCGSALDWTRYLGISNVTLALLTALVAVIAQAAPVVRSALEPRDSRLHPTFMGTGSRRAVLDGTIMNGDVILLISNDGAEAGGVVTGRLEVFWDHTPSVLSRAKECITASHRPEEAWEEAWKREHNVFLALWTAEDEPEIVAARQAIAARLFVDPKINAGAATQPGDIRALVTPIKKDDPLTAPIENASCFVSLTIVNGSGSTEEQHICARCVAVHPLVLQAVRSTFP